MYNVECIKFPLFNGSIEQLQGKLCYFIKPYDYGQFYSLAVCKMNDTYSFKILNKEGTHLDLSQVSKTFDNFLKKNILEVLNVVNTIKLPKCQLFFSVVKKEVLLVDVYNGSNFAGPGMVKDVFGKRIKTQKINKIDTCDKKDYKNVIIKPSVFASTQLNGEAVPLYIRL